MKLNFAIIGCGSIAERHAQQIGLCGGILIACCDTDEIKAKSFAAKYKINSYLTAEGMLQNESSIDVIAVCSPNGLHYIHTIISLNANKHVVCEKPMAIDSKHCKEMIEIAAIKGKKIFMVMQNRFNPPVVELKKIIDRNYLGKISNIHLSCFWNRNNDYYIKSSWKGSRLLDGGILYTQFSHFIDILLWIFGEVETINATIGNFNHKDYIEFEDAGIVLLKFKNNILGTLNYSVNAYKKNFEGSLTVIGENGIIKVGGAYLNKLEYCNIQEYEPELISEGNSENNYGEYAGSMSNHNLVYENVMAVFNNTSAIATTGLEGLKTVELIQNIYKSATWI